MKTTEGAEGQNGAFQGQNAPRGRGAVDYIGECPCAAPIPQGQGQGIHTAAELVPQVFENFRQSVAEAPPAAPPKPISILLDHEQAELLTESSANAFIVIGRGSYPHSAGRWQLWAIPCSIPQADAACRVAQGISKESKPRTSKP
jgi:hypothetical protein